MAKLDRAGPADNALIVRSGKNKKLLDSLARRTAIGGFPMGAMNGMLLPHKKITLIKQMGGSM